MTQEKNMSPVLNHHSIGKDISLENMKFLSRKALSLLLKFRLITVKTADVTARLRFASD